MGCFSPDAPAPVNYGAVTRDTLQAQVDLAPQQYASEAQYQPRYADLALQNMNRLLSGTPGGAEEYSYQQAIDKAGWYDANGQFLGANPNQYASTSGATGPGALVLGRLGLTQGTGTAMPEGVRWLGQGARIDRTGTRNTEATPGLLAMMAQSQSAQRAADVADVATLGPQAREALLAANPESAALLAKLNAQANTGLDAGTNLTPEEQRAMQQAARAAWAARGLGASNGATADELLAQFNLGNMLQRQRQSFAQSVLGNNQSVLGDPFMQILGRGSNATQQAQGIGQTAGPSLFNPEAGLGLAASNYATQTNFAAANNPLANISGVLGGVGNFATGLGNLF